MNMGVDLSIVIFLLAAAVGMLALGMEMGRVASREKKPFVSQTKGSALYGIRYSFTKGMFPWNKESGRLHPFLFWAGVNYHIGIFLAFGMLLYNLAAREQPGLLIHLFSLVSLVAAGIGAVQIFRRFTVPELKVIHTPDDFISACLVILFLLGASLYGLTGSHSIFMNLSAAILFLYIPFSKIRHMIAFFFCRYYLGEENGRKGIYRAGEKNIGLS